MNENERERNCGRVRNVREVVLVIEMVLLQEVLEGTVVLTSGN